MKDWIHFITLLMATIIILIMISSLYGCTYIAKETLRVTDIIVTDLKDKTTHDKKNKKYEDEKQEIIDCIKMVKVCE